MYSESNLWYENDSYGVDVDGRYFVCYVYAEAVRKYVSGCSYMSNGDPGYPTDDELEITKLEVSGFCLEEDPDYIVSNDEKSSVRAVVREELCSMEYEKWSEAA